MKKLHIISLLALMTMMVLAQQTHDMIYVYQKDGDTLSFLCSEIAEIYYGYEEDGLTHNAPMIQWIVMEDSIYKIPVSNIDSVSFVTLQTDSEIAVTDLMPILTQDNIDGNRLITENINFNYRNIHDSKKTFIVTLKYKTVLYDNMEQASIGFYIRNRKETLWKSILFTLEESVDLTIHQWRIPPIPDGYYLNITVSNPRLDNKVLVEEFTIKQSETRSAWNGGLRLDAHLGFQSYAPENTLAAFESAAVCGYPACIVTPIASADGTFYCYHENNVTLYDEINRKYFALSAEEFHSKTDTEISQYLVLKKDAFRNLYKDLRIPTLEEFFSVCARTGMNPVFSTHPALTTDQWIYVRKLASDYGLLDRLTVKAFSNSILKSAFAVLGKEILGYTKDTGSVSDIETQIVEFKNVFNNNTNGILAAIEIRASEMTQSVADILIANGIVPSIWKVYDIYNSWQLKQFISYGVQIITDDNNCNAGLNW